MSSSSKLLSYSMAAKSHLTLTSVPGFRVGHAQNNSAATGVTVVLCPERTAGAVDQRGGAPGTRETDLLAPSRLVLHVNAVVLSGGSAFGLAAADGVMAFLEEQGTGFPTRAGPVPIVPAAVIYDLDVGDSRVRPDAVMGRAACRAASASPVREGSVGAGTGARVGTLRGAACATKGGLGSAAVEAGGGVIVGALVVVNAFGDVIGEDGRAIAGLREGPRSRKLACTADALKSPGWGRGGAAPPFGQSTVIGVVATNARFGREDLARIAGMAHDGIARAVAPAHTLLDGDTIFALASGEREGDAMAVGTAAAEAVAAAVRRGVLQAAPLGGVPSCARARSNARK